jgi:hypothetical protein
MASLLSVSFKSNYSTVFSRNTAKIITQVLNPPTKVSGVFGLFVKDRFNQVPSKESVTSRLVQLAQEWRELDDQKKQEYIDRSNQEKFKYSNQKDEFMRGLTENGMQLYHMLGFNRVCIRGRATLRDLPKEEREWIKNLPKPPASSAKGSFFSSFLKGTKKPDLKAVNKAWDDLSVQAKSELEAKWKMDVERYTNQLKEFINQKL